MKKRSKKFKLVMFLAFFAMIFTGVMIYAQNENGKINLSKTATKIYEKVSNDNLEYGRFAKVDLNITANPYTESTSVNGKLDIVIVFDGSGSMQYDQRLINAQAAARDFANTLMDDTGNVQIGFVEYGSDLKDSLAITDDKDEVLEFINTKLDADGGTNLQAGIAKANDLLATGGRSDAKKIVIILTDGVPTFFNYDGDRYGRGNSDNSVCVEYTGKGNNKRCTKYMKPSEAAKIELDALKAKYSDADVYTITFGNEPEAASILANINPENKEPLYKNYKALSGSDLKENFEEIIELSKNIIGKNSVVTDVIPSNFKLTDESKQELISAGVTVTENSDGTTTLTWNVGNIEAGKTNTLSYEVKANDDYHGSMYTNESATLSTTVEDTNPYYDSENLSLNFEKPTVEIPAITNDDHYNNNESYTGYEGETITGTSILTNDLNKNIETDSENASVTVTDKIVIVENDNVVKNSDGTYSVYKNSVKQGVLTINEDGTFSFDSVSGVTGEVNFDYYIATLINPNSETGVVYSNTSTVTIKILARSVTTISGEKIWNDNNNQDGKRPKQITVELYAGDDFVTSKEVNASSNWTYSFDNLYVYQKGHENDDSYKINYTVKEKETTKDYTVSYDGYDIINTHEIEKTKVEGIKTWDDNDNQDGKRPQQIIVELYANGEKVAEKEVTASSNWSYSFTDLDKYKDGKEITYTIDEVAIPGYTKKINGYNITNTHEIEKTKVEGTKEWVDENNKDGLRPDSITVELYANGVKVAEKVVTASDNWSYSFTDLDKYSNGSTITYTVEEKKVDNYETSVEKQNDKFIITNTHEVKSVTVSGTKTWVDGNNKYGRPDSITVNLTGKAGDETVVSKSKVVTASSNWTYEFTDLPEYKNGKKITYTISENAVKDYDTTIDGYDITNTYNPETTSVKVTKTWDDNNNQDGLRPGSITVELYANGEKVAEKEVTANDNWTYEFTNLVKYAKGVEINYTIKEKSVADYDTVINGYNITNKHIPEVVSKTVKKEWNDDNNRDKVRPESITVILLKDGKEEQEITLSDDNNWTYTFNNLPKYRDGGVVVKYSVEEIEVNKYETDIEKKDDGFVITNTHEIEKNNLVINKTWKDNNNQDRVRPDSINATVIGTVDGNEVSRQIVTIKASDNWRYEFTDLPKNSNGAEITYTVVENDILDSDGSILYKAEDAKYNDNVVTLTNTHEVYKIDITGEKKWVDSNDKDGLRPDSIIVDLYANGVKVASKEVKASDNWKYTFTNLDKNQNGEEINYTVDETVDSETAKHYSMDYDDDNNFIIVNTHSPKDVTVSGTKTWNDDDNKYGRPDSITVNLFANGEKIDSKVVTSNDNWSYSFTNLPEYKNGNLVNYTVNEDNVLDYDTTIEGYNITNTYNPTTIDITGLKTWDDNDDQDGIRPDNITVILYDHLDNVVDRTIVSEDTNWTYTFENLPKYANGKEIKYTVKEVTVDGYETIINNYDITNTHNPEVISFKVTKQWLDNNNQDGIRPDKITVKLYRNDILYTTAVISASNDWTYTFENLPKYIKGRLIEYKIVEDEVKGYTSDIKDSITASKENNNVASLALVNTHEVEKIDIKVTKTWKDNNNESNTRPNSINVNIFANGELFKQITLTKDINWIYILNDLDKFKDGKEILYTIEELSVNNYITTYDGYNIINTLKEVKKPMVKQLKSITNTEITPPYTGVNDSDDNNLIVSLVILTVSTVLAVPTRKLLLD
ncbi:MAG: Cna B-type domain-containing protein [Bacilli bacterium]